MIESKMISIVLLFIRLPLPYSKGRRKAKGLNSQAVSDSYKTAIAITTYRRSNEAEKEELVRSNRIIFASLLSVLILAGTWALDPKPDGVAVVDRSGLQLSYGVSATINAPTDVVWSLLTDAQGYTSWNSTVVSLDGSIEPGGRIALVSTVDPERVFTLRVRALEPGVSMQWRDGFPGMFRGVRTFLLAESNGTTTFTMVERLRGLMVPFAAGSLPDFRPSFEQFAADLKAAAER